jgi:hypothetical protein
MKKSNTLTGVAGEYYVAAELSNRGYIASITLRHTRGVDILASNENATKQVAIQVKTSSMPKKVWMLNEKAEEYFGDSLFYVFVDLKGETQRPDFFIVPSKIVAKYVRQSHIEWLNTPGRGGRKRNDSQMRRFRDPAGQYLEKWELLGL